MTKSDTSKLLEKFVDFINAPTESKARELISPEIELMTPISAVPFKGPAGYLELLNHLRVSFPDVQWRLEETIEEGDRIACRFTATGTHKGDFMGISHTGRQVVWSTMNFYAFKDGMLVQEFANPDLLAVLVQLGGKMNRVP